MKKFNFILNCGGMLLALCMFLAIACNTDWSSIIFAGIPCLIAASVSAIKAYVGYPDKNMGSMDSHMVL